LKGEIIMESLEGIIADTGNKISPAIDAAFSNAAIGTNVAILGNGFNISFLDKTITITNGLAVAYGYKGWQEEEFTQQLIGLSAGFYYVYLEWNTLEHTFKTVVELFTDYEEKNDDLSVGVGTYKLKIYRVNMVNGTIASINDLTESIRISNPYIADYVRYVNQDTKCVTQAEGDNSNAPASTEYVYNVLDKLKMKDGLDIKINAKVYNGKGYNSYTLNYPLTQRADMFTIDESNINQDIDISNPGSPYTFESANPYKFDSLEPGTIIGTVPFNIGSGTPNRLYLMCFTLDKVELSSRTIVSGYSCIVDSNKNIKIEKNILIDGFLAVPVTNDLQHFRKIILTGSFYVKNYFEND